VSVPRRTAGATLPITLTDSGSGVDPRSVKLFVDGKPRAAPALHGSVLKLPLARGRHVVRVIVSDFQESKNMEDVGPILPNTRMTGDLVVRRR